MRDTSGGGDNGVASARVTNLFAAATGALLAWTHYLLAEQIGHELPVVPARILHEVQRRIAVQHRGRLALDGARTPAGEQLEPVDPLERVGVHAAPGSTWDFHLGIAFA